MRNILGKLSESIKRLFQSEEHIVECPGKFSYFVVVRFHGDLLCKVSGFYASCRFYYLVDRLHRPAGNDDTAPACNNDEDRCNNGEYYTQHA